MNEDSKNIDSYLENHIRLSLKASASADFTFELMKRVELEREFIKEDVRTQRMVRYVIGSLISLMAIFAVIIGFVLKPNEDGEEISYFNSLIDRFSTFVEKLSLTAAETFGLAFNFETGIIILLIMVCVFLFSFAEKIIFRKS